MDQDISTLETAVALMFSVYMQHKGEDETLSKQEFRTLLKEELPSFGEQVNPDDVFKSADMNQDGSVAFQEFAMLVAIYASSNYEVLQTIMKDMKEKQSKK